MNKNNNIKVTKFKMADLMEKRNFGDILFPLNEEEVVYEEDKHCQWESVGNKSFYPKQKIKLKKIIPSGYYKINFDNDRRSYFIQQKNINSDELINLPIDKGVEIIDDLKMFWDMKDRYEKYNLIHKRGILMYGPPGSGKTCILNRLIYDLISAFKGIVFSIEDAEDLENFCNFSSTLRDIEPDRPLIVIIEDIDGLLDNGRGIEKMLLNVLDGINQIKNVAYIATTNYPEKMEARLINRPGRFDRRFKIGYPTAKVRLAFFDAKLKDGDEKTVDIKAMVEKTAKLTIAHCKEIFTEHVIKGRDLDVVVDEMKKMNSEKLHSDNDLVKKGIGFGKENDTWDDDLEGVEWNLSEVIKRLKKNKK